jgi:hypothetical protein
MIDKRWVVNLKGKDHVLYAGLLDAASKAGLKSIEVKLVQYPAPENGHLAISEATVVFEDGRLFSEVGDAGPQNCSAGIAAAACRMSATRAKGRALRDALNIGEAMVEEFGPDAEHQTAPSTNHNARTGVQRARHDPEDAAQRETAPDPCSVCGVEVPATVARAAQKKFGVTVCIQHGRELVEASRAVAEEAVVGVDG